MPTSVTDSPRFLIERPIRHPKNSTKTAKRKRQDVQFCFHYAESRNGTQSVIKARIPSKQPRQMAASLLRLPHIQAQIAKQYAIVDARLQVPEQLAEIAKSDANIAKLKVRQAKAEAEAEALTLKRNEEALALKRKGEADRVESPCGRPDNPFEGWDEATQRAHIWGLCEDFRLARGREIRQPSITEFRANGYRLR